MTMTMCGTALTTRRKWTTGRQSSYRWDKVRKHNNNKANVADPSYENCLQEKLKSEIAEHDTEAVQEPPVKLPEVTVILSDTTSEEGDETASEEDDDRAASPKENMPSTSTVNLGLAGLNRAQMERERLERLKRTRPTNENEPPIKHQRVENQNEQTTSSKAREKAPAAQGGNLLFPDGTIKWTYAVGYPKESHHITIEEVLQKDTLKAAVLSGFQVTPKRILCD
jgi:hypothetical protein